LAGRSPFAYCTRRSIQADGHKIAPGVRDARGLPRRPRHFAPYRLARFSLVVLALVGVVALALLVLGLLNVHVVTDHFRIH
jgi:hypothetical protein